MKLPADKRAYLLQVGVPEERIQSIEDDLDRLAAQAAGKEFKETDRYGRLDIVGLLAKQRAETGVDLVAVLIGEKPTPKERALADAIAKSVWLNLAGLPHLAAVLLKGSKR